MKNKAIKTVSFILAATMLSKVMGFVRDILIASRYGTGIEADAFNKASQIPTMFFELAFGAAILSTFIPIFNGFLEKNGRERAFEFSNNFINITVLISAVFTVISMFFAKQLAYISIPGFDAQALNLTATMIVIMVPIAIFTTVAFFIVGILQSFDEFNIPAIISLVSNIAVIIYLIFFNGSFGIYGLAFAMLIGWSLQVFVQIPALIKKGYKYKFTLNFKDEGIKEVFKLALPILISSCFYTLSVYINDIFASYLGEGTVSALGYSNRLLMIVGVVALSVTNYIFPSLSRLHESDTEAFSAVLKQSVRVIMLIITPITLGIMILSTEIITIAYGYNVFDQNSITLTSTALFYYAIGTLSYGMNEVITKAYFAMKNVKAPMIASVAGVATIVALSYSFTKIFSFGIGSLALSVSIATVVISIVLLMSMNRKVKFIDKSMVAFALKIICATALMTVTALLAKKLTADYAVIIQSVATAACGGAVYLISIYLLKIEELKGLIKHKSDN